MSEDEQDITLDDDHRRLLREILEHYRQGRALPEVKSFRRAHASDIPRLDQLKSAYLRIFDPGNEHYYLTMEGLRACASPEAKTAYQRCAELLGDLQAAFVEAGDAHLWTTASFGNRLQRSAEEIARIVTFLRGERGLSGRPDFRTGFIEEFFVDENINKVTLPEWPGIIFQVTDSRFKTPRRERPSVILHRDNWNDYTYVTLFHAYYAHASGEQDSLGMVKILRRGSKSTQLPPTFHALEADSCSLGQSLEYYERLASLGRDEAHNILTSLRDAAYLSHVAAEFLDNEGFQKSLLRDSGAEIALREARSRFFEEATVVPPENPPDFVFSRKLEGFEAPHVVHFTFSKGPARLGRMMALVGKNGTGKTRLLAALAHVLSGLDSGQGKIEPPEQRRRVVAISFSAFDRFARPLITDGSYSYYGLRRPAAEVRQGEPSGRPRHHAEVLDLKYAFFRLDQSLQEIGRRGEGEERRWRDMVAGTGFFRDQPHVRDPFEESIASFLDDLRDTGSGHQMLVFVATAIIESVRAGTVVLFDEPEIHFHPNMLSTLLRLLYDALEQTDAYAVLATHSPIVVQEIPRRHLRIIRLEGRVPIVDAYERESFGENLSEVVQYAFDVEEGDKSYVTILRDLAERMTREEVEALFEGDLGLGARMVLRDAYRPKGKPE